jgi:hypothetical protein
MKRLFIISTLLLLCASFLWGQFVSSEQAAKIGKNYISYAAVGFSEKSPKTISDLKLINTENQNPGIYVINFDEGGFILVSADRRAYPILAYSFEDSFDTGNMAPATQLWISKYLEQFDLIITQNIELPENITELWKQVEYGTLNPPRNNRGVQKLMNTNWNQDYPYNYYCPYHPQGPGQRVYAGCVATAMAQIMKYWNYPENGKGTVSHHWGEYFYINLDTVNYEWDKMTNVINSSSRDAISKLIYHCGVTANMNYSYTGSSSTIENAFWGLRQNFRYRPGAFIKNKDKVDDQTWKFLLKEDLDKLHPILYRGTNNNGEGHAFVCDGYQDTSYFHFNWGWGGYSDGFYYLDPINPQMSFKWGQGAVFNLTPNDANYCSNMEYNQPAWTFDDGSGPNYYFNNTNCSWQISLDTLNFSAIKIYFTKFDLLDNDYLRLYEGTDETGTLLGTYTRGTNPPAQIISNSNKIFIKFETNGTGQANGWEISYETVLTGINSFNARHVEIYPNPLTDLLYLKGIESGAKISISDIYGKILISIDNYNGNEIDLSNLKSGIYILNLCSENLNKSFKIMKN